MRKERLLRGYYRTQKNQTYFTLYFAVIIYKIVYQNQYFYTGYEHLILNRFISVYNNFIINLFDGTVCSLIKISIEVKLVSKIAFTPVE